MKTDDLQIREPCTEDWDALEGRGARRFCRVCSKHVHDLSAMTEARAREVLRTVERPCIRYTCDGEGQIRFRPEPAAIVPLSAVRPRSPARSLRPAAAVALALAACAPHQSERMHDEQLVIQHVVQGAEVSREPIMGAIPMIESEPAMGEALIQEEVEVDEPCDAPAPAEKLERPRVRMGKPSPSVRPEPTEVKMGDWAGPQ